jgi:formate hydrogenlyase subunit 6/NADH:ubiquinone oxidoreductase subunit I
MNILSLIAGNWAAGPQTLRFPERQAPTPDYRGNVMNDASKCVACGICAQVCVSAAIELRPAADSCSWVYDPASCTFCGSCVIYCPVDALTQAADRGPTAHRRGDQTDTTVVENPPCAECGKPAMPYSENLVNAAYGARVGELRDRARLCGSCRRHATAQVMKKAFGAISDTDRRSRAR